CHEDGDTGKCSVLAPIMMDTDCQRELAVLPHDNFPGALYSSSELQNLCALTRIHLLVLPTD
ncbi:hypothetical protein Cadr_000027289, partial [Camelus dromedarius]